MFTTRQLELLERAVAHKTAELKIAIKQGYGPSTARDIWKTDIAEYEKIATILKKGY